MAPERIFASGEVAAGTRSSSLGAAPFVARLDAAMARADRAPVRAAAPGGGPIAPAVPSAACVAAPAAVDPGPPSGAAG